MEIECNKIVANYFCYLNRELIQWHTFIVRSKMCDTFCISDIKHSNNHKHSNNLGAVKNTFLFYCNTKSFDFFSIIPSHIPNITN